MSYLPSSYWLLAILTLSHVDLAWSRQAIVPDPPPQAKQGLANDRIRLPIRLYLGYLVIVEGSIGERQKLSFLVDTGACPSVVDQRIVKDLKLTEQPKRVNLWNQSVEAKQVVIPSMSLGPIRVESMPVLAEDLSFLQKALGFKVDAIVGMDVLRKSSFTINYKVKEILFGVPEDLTHSIPLRPIIQSLLFGWSFRIGGCAWWWIRAAPI